MDLLSFFRTLTQEEWAARINSMWTVKDLVAHLVGWEKAVSGALRENWTAKKAPWFTRTDDFNDFNAKNVERYKNYSPEELLAEWQRWQKELDRQIKEIGEDVLRAAGPSWGWLFDEGENSHSAEHYAQIKKVLKRDRW